MEKNYQVLARKYRPQKFSEVVGQPVLIQTLSNAIKNNRIAHAFILTGIRGIGKTSTARIIAKSLNCVGADGNGKETIDICGVCPHCIGIANSTDADVIEFDAASHTGVDDIRDIIDTISYAPIASRYKIYIIDEVHMLSKSAFNALLKTLEEPPPYVKFIFATTEINKVPITILSRCQRFDLRRLTFEEIKEHLKNISSKEGFEAEDGALSLLASASEGSVRDSLSLLDTAFSHNNYEKLLTEKVVFDMLGLSSKNEIFDLIENMLTGNFEGTINKFNEIYSVSSNINTILQNIIEIMHEIIMAKTINNYLDESHLPSDQKSKIDNIIKNANLSSLIKIWNFLLKGSDELRNSINSKRTMEILLLRITHSTNIPDLADVIKNIQTEITEGTNKESITEEVLRIFSGASII